MASRWKVVMLILAIFVMAHFVHAGENDAEQVQLSKVVMVQHVNLTASGLIDCSFIHSILELRWPQHKI